MTAPDRMAAVDSFYRVERATLEKTVARRVSGANRALIEDACQIAWTVLLRRPDIKLDERGLAWLACVATREAWKATRAREISAGVCSLGDDREPVTGPSDPGCPLHERIADRERHKRRVTAFTRLKPAERQALAFQAMGYSYREIGELTGATYTAVNRRLSEGRARLHRHADDNPTDTI